MNLRIYKLKKIIDTLPESKTERKQDIQAREIFLREIAR
jgi:hypothetical protein